MKKLLGYFCVLAASSVLTTAGFADYTEGIDDPEGGTSSYFGGTVFSVPDLTGDAVSDLYIANTWRSNQEGAGWIFSGADFTTRTLIVSPNPEFDAYFGHAVSIADTGGGNSPADILITAPYEDGSSITDSGRIYIVDLVTGDPPTVAGLTPFVSPSPEVNGEFGASVAVIQDVNSDTVNDYIVGAPGESGGDGRVYILSGANPSTVLETITNPSAATGGAFGGITILPDINSDGIDEFIISATQENRSAQTNAGAAYVMTYDGLSSPSLLYTLTRPGGDSAYAFFGSSDSIDDINSDGKADIVVSSRESSGGQSSAGVAYFFSGATGSYIDEIASPNPGSQSYFGLFKSRVPDMDGDGIDDVALSNGSVNNSVYFYSGDDRALLSNVTFTFSIGPNHGNPHLVDDYDGDGVNDLMIATTYRPLSSYFIRDVYYFASEKDVQVEPLMTDFGVFDPNGSGTTKTISVSNNGLSVLSVSSAAFTGSSEYTVISNPAPATVPGQGTMEILISFDPADIGQEPGLLTVNSDDASSASVASATIGEGYVYSLTTGAATAIVGGYDRIVAADLVTGDRTVISESFATGTGPSFYDITGLVAEDSSTLLASNSYGDIIRVDRSSGNRTYELDSGTNVLGGYAIKGMAKETSGSLVLFLNTYPPTVWRWDLDTDSGSMVGEIFDSGQFNSLTIAPDDSILVNVGARLWGVDPDSGQVTLHDGSLESTLLDMEVMNNGDFVGIGYADGMYRMDKDTWYVQPLSNNQLGIGEDYVFPSAAAVSSGGWTYLLDATEGAIFLVNPNSGNRVLLTRYPIGFGGSTPVGSGPGFEAYFGGVGSNAMIVEGTAAASVRDWSIFE